MMLSLKIRLLSFGSRLADLGFLFGVWSVTAAIGSTTILTAQTVDEKKSDVPANWIEALPSDFRGSILWSADYETGNLDQWSIPSSRDPGGGVLLTDDENVTARATESITHSGKYSGEATIRNAIRAKNGSKAVRFMRWATKAYDQGGVELPSEGYYSTWVYLPEAYDPKKQAPWDPGDGGWWNVFQFKSNDEQNESQSAWTLNIQKDPQSQHHSCYLYSHINTKKSWSAAETVKIPVKQWFHLEAFVKVSSEEQGQIEVWLDGVSIIRAENVRTAVNSQRPNIVWGIGNYTDHIAGGKKLGTATIYFDDSLISTKPVAPFVR